MTRKVHATGGGIPPSEEGRRSTLRFAQAAALLPVAWAGVARAAPATRAEVWKDKTVVGQQRR